ncbi:MAG: hypothetical protein N3B16_09055 [Candidatus Aminicenantes bacterium]|nr:hypothetical protein [Candidatus Aminicenantes bacterium]
MRIYRTVLVFLIIILINLTKGGDSLSFCYPISEKKEGRDFEQAMARQRGIAQKPQPFGENLIILKLLRMTKALDLQEDQAAKIFPFANRIEKEKMKLNRELNQEIRELRTLLQSEKPEERQVKEKLMKIRNLKESIRLKEVEFEVFLEKNLTTIQQGKYILFNIDFAQFINRNLERMRNLKNSSPSPSGKKTPEK